jgi:calcium/calmodulin-dependent protein kinase kinase 2
MKQLNHPNLMRIFEVIDSPSSDKLYLVMPVADYGECMSFDGETKQFVPNHRLQARNVNKIMKMKKVKRENYYDEE